jgi:antitoxin CcdA
MKAGKKPTSHSADSDRLEKERALWLEENRESIAAYNEHVAQHGVFSTGLRSF